MGFALPLQICLLSILVLYPLGVELACQMAFQLGLLWAPWMWVIGLEWEWVEELVLELVEVWA